jgi:nicotinate-nucleotide pyrophosphorylase (carboxylating)
MLNLFSAKDSERQEELLQKLLDLAFLEDFGAPRESADHVLDLTTAACVAETLNASGEILLKETAVVAGLPFLTKVMERLSAEVKVETLVEDGTYIEVARDKDDSAKPVPVARLKGPARAILMGERLALNIMQRLSGIASQTRLYAAIARPHGIAILDTRKTTPGMRVLERYGVRAGGGTNHRFGLFDAVLIKDNHINIAGGIKPALQTAQSYLKNNGQIVQSQILEIEVSSLNELDDALDLDIGRVLLDNMTPDMVRQAIQKISARGSKCFVEVSGGVTLENLNGYMIAGVNAVSTGALTHSARNIDLSLEFTSA